MMIGLLVAAIIATTLLSYKLAGAREAAGVAQAEARQLRSTIEQQNKEIQKINRENDRRERIVMQAVTAQEKAQREARELNQQLQGSLADDECAQTPHPDAVADSLRFGATGTDPD